MSGFCSASCNASIYTSQLSAQLVGVRLWYLLCFLLLFIVSILIIIFFLLSPRGLDRRGYLFILYILGAGVGALFLVFLQLLGVLVGFVLGVNSPSYFVRYHIHRYEAIALRFMRDMPHLRFCQSNDIFALK